MDQKLVTALKGRRKKYTMFTAKREILYALESDVHLCIHNRQIEKAD